MTAKKRFNGIELGEELRHASPGKGVAVVSVSTNAGRWTRLIKKFGVAGFCFFLIKGLLWLIVPALLAYFGSR